MIKEDKRLSTSFSINLIEEGEKEQALNGSRLTRISGNRMVTFEAKGASPGTPRVYLHANFSGDSHELLPMKRSQTNRDTWFLEKLLPTGGLIQITVMMETDKNRYWDPAGYRKILIDPNITNNLRLYSYIPNGQYPHWIKDLESIKEMGFNAVHLLPLTQMGYSRSPYAAHDLFQTDSAWGREEDFNSFIEQCEKKQLALCFDIVLNHISCDSYLAKTKAHWIVGDRSRKDGMKRAGCWHQNKWISWEELVLINYDHPDKKIKKEIWHYMRDYLFHWASLSHSTGGLIRLDNLHSSHGPFIEWVLQELRSELPGIGVLSEYFETPQKLKNGVYLWGLNLLLGNSWEYPFVPQLQNYLNMIHTTPELRYLLMPTTHDTESVTQLFGGPDSVVPRYFTCTLMGTGQSGLTMGSEWGEPEKITFIKRDERLLFSIIKDYRGIIGKINRLHKENKIFRTMGNGEFLPAPSHSLLVFRRWSYQNNREVLLLANFDTREKKKYHCERNFSLLLNQGLIISKQNRGSDLEIEPCGVAVLELAKKGAYVE